MSHNYLLCRCTHKPNPFPYDNAWIDQIGNFDYVDVISKLIVKLITENITGVYNVGTEVKTMYELATQTKEVGKILTPTHVPKNQTMNLDKLNDIVNPKPFFSIAIPTYGYDGRGVEVLEHSLNILVKQTFKDFNVVLSDHSTDDTIKNVYKNYCDKLNMVYYRNELGRGIISPNINNAMRLCRGHWIKVLFQDDFLFDENSLQIQHDFILKNADIKWLMTTFYHSNDGTSFYRLFNPVWNDLIWTGNNTMGCPSGMTLKNEDLLFFNENLNWLMDVEYYKQMFDKHGLPAILPEITYANRTWENRLTARIPQSIMDAEFKILNAKYGT
jgi:hypothetical protein